MDTFKNVDAGKAAIDKLAIGASDATLQRQLAEIIYGVGVGADRKANAAPDCTPIIDAFNTKFRGNGTGRKDLKEGAAKTYRSVFNQYALLGFAKWKADDRDQVLAWILDNAKMAYSTRGKFIKEVATMATCPQNSDLEALIDGPTYNKTAGLKELKATAARIEKSITLLAFKAAKVKETDKEPAEPQFDSFLVVEGERNEALYLAYAKLVAAAQAFAAATATAAQGGAVANDAMAELLKAAA
jgi:hypothetical protein